MREPGPTSEKKNGHAEGPRSAATPGISQHHKELIREQLGRILASPLFSHSKRFPDFLRYTVSHALDHDTEGIKERTLGVEVFGRDPEYDTNTDPVVRMTAVEVRKRLAQYYALANHGDEPKIEFARGSYIPEFKFPREIPLDKPLEVAPQIPTSPEPRVAASTGKAWRLSTAALLVLLLTSGGVLVGMTRKSPFDRFWAPVVASRAPVIVCVPDMLFLPLPPAVEQQPPTPARQAYLQMPTNMRRNMVVFSDLLAVTTISRFLGSRNKDFHVRHSEDVSLDQMKEGPVVLVGAFNNEWMLRLGAGFRYHFDFDGATGYIRDEQNPSSRQWMNNFGSPTTTASTDYGLVSRVFDSTTGRVVITTSGIFRFGTEAAGECITDPECIDQAAKIAPGNWSESNVQIVIETKIINGDPSKPTVLAARTW